MVERGEEHDRDVGDRLGEVLASYRHVDRADEGEVAEGEGEQLQEYVAGTENVRVVRAVETAVAAGTVAGREDEAAAHVMHALAAVAATTLDARRRRHDALHSDSGAACQAVASLARNIAPQTGVIAGARAGAGANVVAALTAGRLLLLFGAEDAQADVPRARFGKGHVHVSRLGRVHVNVCRRETLSTDAATAGSDVRIVP